MNLQSEFIPYEEAKELKHLGFNEKGLYSYASETIGLLKEGEIFANPPTDSRFISAPTWRQAFKFFADKFNLFGKPYVANMGAVEYSFDIYDIYEEKYAHDNLSGGGSSYSGTFDTPEEAELACLKKLIEIAKK